MKLLKTIERIVFPSRCVFCTEVLPFGNKELICDECASRIEEISGIICEKCGRPIRYHGQCRQCNSTKHRFDTAFSVYLYKDEVRSAIHRFKYGSKGSYAAYFGRAMATFADYNDVPFVDYVVPVPVHKSRLRRRGFNQSELLARVYAEHRDETVLNLLVRIKHTKAQSGLNTAQRLENIKGAFALADTDENIKGKTVLLIDDIFTTGSTLDECTRVLKKAGISKVYVLCLSIRDID